MWSKKLFSVLEKQKGHWIAPFAPDRQGWTYRIALVLYLRMRKQFRFVCLPQKYQRSLKLSQESHQFA